MSKTESNEDEFENDTEEEVDTDSFDQEVEAWEGDDD